MPLSAKQKPEVWIKDFVHSDNPKFKGKDKKTRIKMALAAYYAKKAAGIRKKNKEKRKKKSLREDATAMAVNNIGGGNIEGAGIGPKGEPGVRRKKKKKYKTPPVIFQTFRRRFLKNLQMPVDKVTCLS